MWRVRYRSPSLVVSFHCSREFDNLPGRIRSFPASLSLLFGGLPMCVAWLQSATLPAMRLLSVVGHCSLSEILFDALQCSVVLWELAV